MKRQLEDLLKSDFNLLEKKIDSAFTENILNHRINSITNFFYDILSFKNGFHLVDDSKKLEVIEIYFYPSAPLSYLIVNPCHYFCSDENIKNEPSLSLESYSYIDIENLIISVLKENKIDCSKIENEEIWLDEIIQWENRFTLELDFVIKCWKTAKEKANSSLKAFFVAGDSSGNPIDMDNGNEVQVIGENSSIEKYLKLKNIFPNKDLLN